MSEEGLKNAQEKMQAFGVSPEAITVFSHYYQQLEAGTTGLIPESSIRPLEDVDHLEDVTVTPEEAKEAFAKTVMIKLNGGLATSMGLSKAKSLLEVRNGLSFLDIISQQVLTARKQFGVSLPVVFMNSFRTQQDTLEALEKYPDLKVQNLPLDFLQNQEPKLLADSLEPVTWEDNPSLEWCPPGHGDIYTALYASGILKQLLDAGYCYAMSSNADNLGATPSAEIAGWFAKSGAPYAAELCTRTPNDRKGGHLAIRKRDGQLILRDNAQTPDQDLKYFTDEHVHPFFHSNNLWFDLEKLYQQLVDNDAVLGLPLMVNRKTVDPTDPTSPEVIQMETSMGTAISVFPGATAIVVPRSRFLPVKTTNELTLVRSDIYRLGDDYHLQQVAPKVPMVSLASDYYKQISQFDRRFPQGAPSLLEADSLEVKGDWTFGKDVVIKGNIVLGAEGGILSDGQVLS